MTYRETCALALQNEPKIYVEGYVGSWSVIDTYDGWVLLEHNRLGDETNLILVLASEFEWRTYKDIDGIKKHHPYFSNKVTVYETFGDIITSMEDLGLI